MPLQITNHPVPLQTDECGVVRVGGTRVSLDSVIHQYVMGATAEQIADDFPTLDLADIHDTISYYLRHRCDVEAYLADQRRQADELRKTLEADPQNQILRQRLMERALQRTRNDVASDFG